MTKLTLEIPDELHRTVKSFASAHGESIKDFFVDAVITKLKTSHKTKTPSKTMKKTQKKNSKYITEKEADKLLRPYLLKLIQRLENGEEETYSWDEVKKHLKKS